MINKSDSEELKEPYIGRLGEYKLAHKELMELYNIFWRQCSFFLTLNSALIIIVSIFHPRSLIFNILLSIFGMVICILWIFHGNRIYLLIQVVEEKLRETEDFKEFEMKLKRYQYKVLTKKELPLLQRIPGQIIRNTILPVMIGMVWIIVLLISVYLYK